MDLVRAGQWLAEHLGLPVILLSDALCRSLGGASQGENPNSPGDNGPAGEKRPASAVGTAAPGQGRGAAPSSASSHASQGSGNGSGTSPPAATPGSATVLQPQPAPNGHVGSPSPPAAALTGPTPTRRDRPSAAAVAEDDGDSFLDHLLSDAPAAHASSVPTATTHAAPTSRMAPAAATPEDGDDFLDDLLSDHRSAPVAASAALRSGGQLASQASRGHPAALPPPASTAAAHAEDGDDFLDGLLSDDPPVIAPASGLGLTASGSWRQGGSSGAPVKAPTPADRVHTRAPDGSSATAAASSAAPTRHHTANGLVTAHTQESAGGDASDLLDALMAEDVVHHEVSSAYDQVCGDSTLTCHRSSQGQGQGLEVPCGAIDRK